MRCGRLHLSCFPVSSEITAGFPTSISKRLGHLCHSCLSAVCLVWGWRLAAAAGTLLSSAWRFPCKQQENPQRLLLSSCTTRSVSAPRACASVSPSAPAAPCAWCELEGPCLSQVKSFCFLSPGRSLPVHHVSLPFSSLFFRCLKDSLKCLLSQEPSIPMGLTRCPMLATLHFEPLGHFFTFGLVKVAFPVALIPA